MAEKARNLEYHILAGKVPAQQPQHALNYRATRNLKSLPRDLQCLSLDAAQTGIEELPEGLQVEFKLDLTGCTKLKELPRGLKAGSLVIAGCTSLAALPEDLEVSFLNAEGCVNLTHWPESAHVSCGAVNLIGCRSLKDLPASLGPVSTLNLRGCTQIRELPPGMVVTSWIDIAGTGITGLPPSLEGVRLRWRGVPVDSRIAFSPDSVQASEVMAEQNIERRRVLLERVGNERFIREAKAQIIHADRDAGGERRLLRVPMPGDEDLVVVHVRCPSTAREYLIRVPPKMRTCHQAVAWTAGFDDADDYKPVVET